MGMLSKVLLKRTRQYEGWYLVIAVAIAAASFVVDASAGDAGDKSKTNTTKKATPKSGKPKPSEKQQTDTKAAGKQKETEQKSKNSKPAPTSADSSLGSKSPHELIGMMQTLKVKHASKEEELTAKLEGWKRLAKKRGILADRRKTDLTECNAKLQE